MECRRGGTKCRVAGPAVAANIESPFPPTPLPLPPILTRIATRLRDAGCVYAEEEARLLAACSPPGELQARVERRAAGLPLEHVLGWAEFCGRRIALEPGVFVPRRRSEYLAGVALRLLKPGATVLDLCCGSGALGAVLAASVAGSKLHAADIEPTAVRCARRNLEPWGAAVYEGDLFAPLPAALAGRLDLIVANAPYVPSAAIETLPREARLHEPRACVDGGADGHAVQRRIAAQAPHWLARGGWLLMETGATQADGTAAILRHAGLRTRVLRCEDHDATVVCGRA